jgi:hypothetical protein
MMGTKEDVRLRDVRKAGHCWQDNELYDVFQPIVGANGVNVYVHLTRHASGAQVSCTLRELAARTGLGKDTVRRALLAMVEIGMLRATDDGYDLVDLKQLCSHYGGTYCWKRKSYVLAEVDAADLRSRVKRIQIATQGKPVAVSQRDSVSAPLVSQRDNQTTDSVSQRDKNAEAGETVLSSQRDSFVPEERHASIKAKTKTKTNTPLPPSRKSAMGECAEESADGEIAEAVMSALRVAGKRERRRLRETLLKVISRERAESGLDGEELQALLVDAWEDYRQRAADLRWAFGSPQKFFATGLWADPGRWPLAQAERPMSSQATVGMYRGAE